MANTLPAIIKTSGATPINTTPAASTMSPNVPITASAPIDKGQLTSLLKKITDQTNEKTGLLSNYGEELVSKLNENSPIGHLVREQLQMDQEFDSKWKYKRSRLMKRINYLESVFNEISVNNRNLRAQLMAKPYHPVQESPILQQGDMNMPMNMNSDQQINSNDNSPANQNIQTNSPSLMLHNPSTYDNSFKQQGNYSSNLNATTGSLLSNQINIDSSKQPSSNADRLQNNFTHAVPTTATVTANATVAPTSVGTKTTSDYSQWAISQHQPLSPEQQQQQQQVQEMDHGFEYYNPSHLISGLQDMIQDESEYPDTISNYSKGFTTDQLDNFWANQNTEHPTLSRQIPSQSQFHNPLQSNYMNSITSPSSASYHNNELMTSPLSPQQNNNTTMTSSQSLLAGALSESMQKLNTNNDMLRHSNSFYNESNLNPHNKSVAPVDNTINSILSGTDDMVMVPFPNAISPQSSNIKSPNLNNHILSNGLSSDNTNINTPPQSHDGIFHSPSFNFMWHSSPPATNSTSTSTSRDVPHSDVHSNSNSASTVGPNSTTTNSHRRNQSNTSNTSWGTKFGLKHLSTHSSNSNATAGVTSAETSTSTSEKPTEGGGEDTKNTNNSSKSSTRKMSRLLSRSKMNNLFKLPSQHDSQSQ